MSHVLTYPMQPYTYDVHMSIRYIVKTYISKRHVLIYVSVRYIHVRQSKSHVLTYFTCAYRTDIYETM